MTEERKYRISGHESFPCRYTWLPKAVRGLRENPGLFADEEGAMVSLGVGKNMVRSIRFWAQATNMTAPGSKGSSPAVTPFGQHLLGTQGFDPFLEDIRTLWLIHWNLSTNHQNPLLAWDFLLNRWQAPDLVPSDVIAALLEEAANGEERLSKATLEQHFETFLHTYVSTRSRKGEVQEDNLDCPLVELEFIVKTGERNGSDADKREPIYSFRRDEKPEITPELFAYCLNDFWRKSRAEATLSLKEVAHGHGSPGQIFKLPEDDVRNRVEGLATETNEIFAYKESANLQQIVRDNEAGEIDWLVRIYEPEGIHA